MICHHEDCKVELDDRLDKDATFLLFLDCVMGSALKVDPVKI
jgi:hypothetical protein